MFAIVDIETTGGSAQYSAITEIAVALHNGREVVDWYHTMVNPQQKIPRHITALTGIADHMVADAPLFADVAPKLAGLLEGKVFVAHNVNFDYSFIHHHLQQSGISWQAKKLCTVRYARRVVPGLQSYSLGRLCMQLDIPIRDRHRATGDVAATVQLFDKLVASDVDQAHLQALLKGKNPETYLPMHVPKEQLEALPYQPGVYYFHDKAGKILYVGKARNLRYRVKSHFTNNAANQRKQEFIRNIFGITHEVCATEMMAIVLEELEIKRLWPPFNRSQKRPSPLFALYAMQDQRGFTRLAVEKRRRNLPALFSFHKPEEGYWWGRQMVSRFSIEECLVFATGNAQAVDPGQVEEHNEKMAQAMDWLQQQLPSFLVMEDGEDHLGNPRKVGYWVDKGNFVGMGYLPLGIKPTPKKLPELLKQYPDNDYIKAILYRYAESHPESVTKF